jgi:hypothetical protein
MFDKPKIASDSDDQTGWSPALSRPLKLRDGTTLFTLADGHTFFLSLSRDLQQRLSWQEAARSMLEAFESGQITSATDRLERALFLSYLLDLKS